MQEKLENIFILFLGTAMVCMMTRSVIDDDETFDSSSNTSPVHGKIDLGDDTFVDYNYFQNQSFRENFDELQRSLRCCSFIGSDATSKLEWPQCWSFEEKSLPLSII